MLCGTAKKKKKTKLVTVKGRKHVASFFSVDRGAHRLYSKDTYR